MTRKINFYYEGFIEMVDLACQAAECLNQTMSNYDLDVLKEKRTEMHNIERESDQLQVKIMTHLAKEFMPPFDREDIVSLVDALDDLTDIIEESLIKLHTYHITEIKPEAVAMTAKVVSCAQALKQAVEEFPRYAKSKVLASYLEAVDKEEYEMDLMYIEAVHKLFENKETSARELLIWGNVFENLEDACDYCVAVMSIMRMIILKSS